MRYLIAILLPLSLTAQSKINSSQFLEPIAVNDATSYSTASQGINIPWIEVYEFRTETRDFELDKQEYTVRLTPNSIKKRKAQKEYFETMLSIPDFEGEKIRCDRLTGAYEDWIIMHIMQSKLSIMDELGIILNDRIEVLNRMMVAMRPDLKELADVQKEINELKTGKYDLSLELKTIKTIYGIENQIIDNQDLISLAVIEDRISLMTFDENDLVRPEDQYEMKMIDRELNIEKAEDQQVFDFAQFRYQGPHNDPFEERFSLGVGLRLPNQGNRKIKIKELMLEREMLQYDQERVITNDLKQLDFQKKELLRKISSYKYLGTVNNEETEQLQQISQNVSNKVGADPLFLLEIQERMIRMKIKEIDKIGEILMDYIDLLEDANILCSRPFTNALLD